MTPPRIKASIDLGTNTCLLLIADCDPQKREVVTIHRHESRVVRLGEGVDQAKVLKPEAMERAMAALRDYVAAAQAQGIAPAEITCAATSQARDAKNGDEFLSRIEKELGLRFRVLSGTEEARAAFRGGLLPGMDPATSAIIDIGGGSTEFVSANDSVSIDMGGVRFTERYLSSDPVSDREFWRCREEIEKALAPAVEWRKRNTHVTTLVAVAGTPTTLASWYHALPKFDAAKIDRTVLARGDLHRMVEELKFRTVAERAALVGMEPGRAPIILAGSLILWRALEQLGFKECTVSTRGLLFGIIT